MPRLWVAFSPNSLPVVWARLAQHHFRVLVDTGAAQSLIAPAVASSLRLRLLGTERIIGVTGTVVTVPVVEIIGVGMGQVELSPFQAGILELGALRLGIQAAIPAEPASPVITGSAALAFRKHCYENTP